MVAFPFEDFAMIDRRLLLTLIPLSLLTVSACGDEEDPRVFEEEGTWSLQRFALDGTNWKPIDQMPRDNAFLLRFDDTAGSGTVAAATCVGGGSASVEASTCRIDINHTWECRCFSYIHEEANIMQWQEFAAGEAPPPVVEETGEGMLEDDCDTECDPSVSINVQKDNEVNGAVIFSPLPGRTDVWGESGLFNSGYPSATPRYQFLKKSESLFEESGCAEVCGI